MALQLSVSISKLKEAPSRGIRNPELGRICKQAFCGLVYVAQS